MSNGIGNNPLNDISKVYLEQVAESAVPGKPAEKLGAVTSIPKSEQDAAKNRLLAKAKAKREKMKEALDPVGQEDSDIDNDGDVDKSDKYLGKRRKAIAKAMKKRMKEEVEQIDEISKELATKAYAERRTNEFEGDEKHTKSDKTHARIVKKHGKKAGEDADKAANKKIYGEGIDYKGAARMDAAKKKKKVDVFAYDRKLQAQGKLKGKKLPPPPTNEEVEIDEMIDAKGAARMDAAKKKKKVDVFAYDRKLQAQGKLKGKKLPPPPTNEGFSDWREELREVCGSCTGAGMGGAYPTLLKKKSGKRTSDTSEDMVKEKTVKNKVKINPVMGEETILEAVEIDEFDFTVEGVYFDLQEEGYEQDDIEEALEWVLTEARVTYGSDTESPRQQMMKKAKGRLRFLGRKVGDKMASAKKKVGMASAKAQVAAYNKAREAKQSASDTANRMKKSAADAPKKAKKGLKSAIKGAAQKVVDRMSEGVTEEYKELPKRKMGMKAGKKIVSALGHAAKAGQDTDERNIEPQVRMHKANKKGKQADKIHNVATKHNPELSKMKSIKNRLTGMTKNEETDPKEKQMLAKKKQMMMKQQMLDKQRMQAQQQGKLPSGHRVEQKESMSTFEKVKAELAKKHGAAAIVGTPENKAANAKRKAEAQKNKKKPAPDTRTDAQKMADATGPRPGSRYRGD